MKRHHLLLGLLCSTLLLASCGHKDNNEKQADQKQEETTDTQSQDQSPKEKKQTHTTYHTKQDIKIEVHEAEKKDKAHADTDTNKNVQAKQTQQEADKATTEKDAQSSDSSKKNEEPNLERDGGKVKGPEDLAPGPEADMDRKHIAMMLLDPKLNKTYVNAKDLKQKTYKTDDGQQVRIPNYVLFQSLEVPQVENGPEGMQYYFVTHTKDPDKKTVIGVSDNEIVIGKSTISSEDAVSQKVKLDYNQFIQEEETQVFKVKELEQLKLDSNEINALTRHIYQATPHTLQFVPEN
ncbi:MULTISPECIES: hypothetical protein [Staphylococcus]|uniref:hypothetical protein n=1 Tax=Staphylococcus TaxID=1279 RepID=UPI000763F27B|nr:MULTISPECIES: hypothetical protein [Staphylococcus]KXA42520.1 hypothetical protein HMPREF3215_02132 [Staphylococcus simulans]OFM16536.1 hypothetical protein HMPREF2713_08065 [Staphylococcus sp. HMSC059E03]OFN20438.1 hypothetical protein HMPREF2603_07190 [Staphylococcus sp. HMSC055C03]OFV05438.1 hypothetical protein HMPREF3124_07805 [Staphylococcus sp. HMSC12H08]OHR57550.1 hypothetical protein HMPREF2798_09755 [Staphylococcus sp. HMSC070A03]